MVHLTLTADQQRELQLVSRQAVGRVALRAHMVLLSGRGCPVAQIALIHDCGEDVVRTWLHRYQRLGVAGLYDLPKSGRPPKERLAGPIVDAQASQSPRCSGHVQACWSVGRLTRFLASRFRLRLSVSSVRRYLRRMGWRWARPRLAPAGGRHPDPAAPAKLAALAQAWIQAQQGLAHLLFLDESDLHLLPVVRAMWMKGRRVRVPTPGQNARHAFFGALEAIGGQWHWADHDRKLAIHFVAFLDQLLAAYPTGPLYLVLDNAPTHTAKVVARWAAAHPRAQLLWLPTYAAHEVNPAERIWGLLKSEVAADRLEGNLATLVGHARRFCTELAPHPVKPPAAA
jgi:transposase